MDEQVAAAFHWHLAEAMFALGEVEEAWNVAFDARQMLPAHLHPVLDHALAAYCVLLVAATVKQGNGGTDWYAVLGANPSSDLADLKRHYQCLVKMVHPDKNRSAAADGAFKLVREAWERISATRGRRPEYVIID